MEPPFCSQFICDTGVTHKLMARIKILLIYLFTKSWEREYGGGEENKGEEKEKRGGEGERRSGGENDRSRGGEEGAVLGERRGRESEGGASFLAMQVLEIPARGRGFPLVIMNRFQPFPL